MNGYTTNIEQETLSNDFFRKVLYTGPHSQLVVMSLLPNEEIGKEIHHVDQFIRFEAGQGKVILDGKEHAVKADDAVVIPAGTEHNVINTSSTDKLKLYTVYSPAEHKDGTVHKTKTDAEADPAEHQDSSK